MGPISFHPLRALKAGHQCHGKGNAASERRTDLPKVTRGNESQKEKQLEPRPCPKRRQSGQAGPQMSSAFHGIEQKTHMDQGGHQDCETSTAPLAWLFAARETCLPQQREDFLPCLCLPFKPSSWILDNNLSHLFLRVGTASLHLEILFLHLDKKKNLKSYQRSGHAHTCACVCLCARARVCVCVCARVCGREQLSTKEQELACQKPVEQCLQVLKQIISSHFMCVHTHVRGCARVWVCKLLSQYQQ